MLWWGLFPQNLEKFFSKWTSKDRKPHETNRNHTDHKPNWWLLHLCYMTALFIRTIIETFLYYPNYLSSSHTFITKFKSVFLNANHYLNPTLNCIMSASGEQKHLSYTSSETPTLYQKTTLHSGIITISQVFLKRARGTTNQKISVVTLFVHLITAYFNTIPR